jgi:hypothetical protein
LSDDQENFAAEKFHSLIQTMEFADNELGLDLWLIAEQLMLFRLTRAGERKRYELASLVHAIHEIKSQGQTAVPVEIKALDDSGSAGFRGSTDAKLTEVFSIVVDAAEQMSSEELYRLIALLRKMESPKFEEIDTGPLDNAQEFLSRGPSEDPPWNPLDE